MQNKLAHVTEMSAPVQSQLTIPSMVKGMQDQPSATLVPRSATQYPGQQRHIDSMFKPVPKRTVEESTPIEYIDAVMVNATLASSVDNVAETHDHGEAMDLDS